VTVITLFSFLTHVSHEITSEDLQRAAIRARNVPTSWKNMVPQDLTLSTEYCEGFVSHMYYLRISCCHYKWNFGPLEKFCYPKLILPFRVQKVKKQQELLATSSARP